jgi:hypothetical protein
MTPDQHEHQPDAAGCYHGDGGMTLYDIIDAFRLNFYEASIIKHILRWKNGNDVTDLHKAADYIHESIRRAP